MAEGQSESLAKWNANAGLESLLAKLNNPDFQLFLTGEGNFRYSVYPEYKANRPKQRPMFLKAVKQHLVDEYGAIVSSGCEADDLIGVEQAKSGHECLVVSIDKDLDQIHGWHYAPEISRLGKIVKSERRYLLSPNDAIKFFYFQLLTGDAADNIKGVAGIGKQRASSLLGSVESEQDLFQVVRNAYGCDEELELNAKVLWIWKKENDNIIERWEETFSYRRSDSE